MEGNLKPGEWKLIANIWMQFVEYLPDGSEVWTHESNGKEQLYNVHK
jgi:hypothetical protein